MEKTITIPSSEEKIYEQYLVLLRPIYDISPNERRVVISYMILNNKYVGIEEETLDILFSSNKLRNELKDMSGMKTSMFNNIITKLRSKGIIDGNNIIRGLRIDLSKGVKLIFNLKI